MMSEPRPSSPQRRAAGGEPPGPTGSSRSGLVGIEPDVIAGNPHLLGPRIAELPAIEILAVEERLPAFRCREASAWGSAAVEMATPGQERPGTAQASGQGRPGRTVNMSHGTLAPGRRWVLGPRDRAEGRSLCSRITADSPLVPIAFNLSWSLIAMSDRNPSPSRREFHPGGSGDRRGGVPAARTASASEKNDGGIPAAAARPHRPDGHHDRPRRASQHQAQG